MYHKIERFKTLANRKSSRQPNFHLSQMNLAENAFSLLVELGQSHCKPPLDGGAKVITSAREMTSDRENREHIFVQADLSTSEGCTKVVDEVISHFGGVDILVNVVGGSSAPSGGFSVLSDEEWQKEPEHKSYGCC